MHKPFTPNLARRGPLILDGGLATELEARGYDLSDHLWSARLLRDAPEAIRSVHAAYLAAGADIILTASYQATLTGFARAGLTQDEAAALIVRAVTLAQAAVGAHRDAETPPLVGASVGPYGAYLANGAEYTGAYDLDETGLRDFHRPRWHLLAGARPDFMACETIPSYAEAGALLAVAAETPSLPLWVSFSCRDAAHISDGTPIEACVARLEASEQVCAVGINCTLPQHIAPLIRRVRAHTAKPIVVYPNAGETWDAANRCWVGTRDPEAFATRAREWHALGADIIGGCCRTTPATIAALRAAFR